ncbi:MAG: hypothetical protein AAF533_22895 [Acidobacteriota bacterium]
MTPYTLNWPEEFESREWEIESKGWFAGLEIVIDGRCITPVFYDPVRLSQDISDELSRDLVFTETNLIVIERVCRESIVAAVAKLAAAGELTRMLTR